MKSLKNITLLFLLICFSLNAQQDVFKRYHDIPNLNNYPFFYSDYYNDNLIILGNFLDSLKQRNTYPNYVSYDKKGIKIINKIFQNKSLVYAPVVGNIVNHQIFSFGVILDSPEIPIGRRPLLTKFDLQGNIISDTTYLLNNRLNSYFRNSVYDSISNQFLLLIDYYKNYPTSDNLGFAIAKMDTLGNILFYKEFSDTATDVFEFSSDILINSNRDYIISYTTNFYETKRGNSDIGIICCDSLGNIKWKKIIGKKNWEDENKSYNNKMKFLNNNLIAFSYRSDSSLKIFEHHIHIINENGDSINHLVDKYRFDCIAINKNEEIISAGVHIYKFGPGANDYYQYPAIRKWDKNLNLMWYRYYPIIAPSYQFFTNSNMIQAPDGGFAYTCSGGGVIIPSTIYNTFMFVLKTDSCGFTEGDTCRIRYKVDQLVFNNLKMSIIPSISNYCHATWKVGDSIYTGASIQHTFTKKGLYEIKVSGFAGDSRDSSSIFISVDSIWKQDTTKLNIQTYNILHEMNIYPNPVVNTLEIDWKIPANNSNIEIFNTQGQLMKSILVEDSETNKTINVTDFPIGVYQVIFNMNGKIKSKSRFVK